MSSRHVKAVERDRELARQDLDNRGWKCYLCGDHLTEDTFTADHVKPRSRGGRSVKGNIRGACDPCNIMKGDMTLAEWEELYGTADYRSIA